MNVLAGLRSRLSMRLVFGLGFAAFIASAVVVTKALDAAALRGAIDAAVADPAGLTIAVAAFGLAFVVRAIAWQRVLPSLSFGHALAGIHLSLGANHVLPFRLGEPFRVLSVVRRQAIPLEAATASTVTLRAADMLAVVIIGALVAPRAFVGLLGAFAWIGVATVAAVTAAGFQWLRALAARRGDVRVPGPAALGLSAGAWLLEAVLVWQTAQWAGLDPTTAQAMLVTTVAIAAQIAAFAPGGFGTYEAAAVAAWVTVGHDAETALIAALLAHALKTLYSLLSGGLAVLMPTPSLLGRIRLADTAQPPDVAPAPSDAPVVLFMPAFNEEEAVEACVRRAPATVLDRDVQVIVIDDGSTDATVQAARAAGAEVIEMGGNHGLGAAVRRGFEVGVERNAAAVVFCDADGEYPPEELANMVAPILDGRADYVTGSRFLGDIEHMRPHRRFGNLVLTRLLSLVARRRITDGQTGYRALSLDAATNAEIIHDFNYAQVLTLDLLAKGYRHAEVPISYHFRTTGESFIKLGTYLRNVVPAVYRELNTA